MKVWLKAHPFVAGVLGVIAGGIAFLLALHLYIDHKSLHEMVTFLNQAVANQQKPASGK